MMNLDGYMVTMHWQSATKCTSPEDAEGLIEALRARCNDWEKASGCKSPEELETNIQSLKVGLETLAQQMQIADDVAEFVANEEDAVTAEMLKIEQNKREELLDIVIACDRILQASDVPGALDDLPNRLRTLVARANKQPYPDTFYRSLAMDIRAKTDLKLMEVTKYLALVLPEMLDDLTHRVLKKRAEDRMGSEEPTPEKAQKQENVGAVYYSSWPTFNPRAG